MDRRNYSDWKNMKEAILEALPEFDFTVLRPMLWKDEINDVFILTKSIEIYLYSRSILGCYCWSRGAYLKVRKNIPIFDEWSTDDKLYTFRADIQNLPSILQLGVAFKRRPDIRGAWVLSCSEKLGHQVRPFNPELEKDTIR